MLRAVVDTNVLFEGLTTRGACGDIVAAWVALRFVPCVSTALALEYEEVLTKKLGDKKRPLALGALQALLARVEFVPVLFSVRPMSPDPDDDLVVDAKDFRGLEAALGIVVLSPEEFCDHLRRT